jgi:hypothetical protein
MGTALQNFTDFVSNTGPAIVSGPEQLINEAVKNTYIFGRFLKGRDMAQVIQAGKKIEDRIMFDDASTYQHYKPNDTFSWSNPQVEDEISVNWRFSVDHMSWTDQQIELNIGGGLSRSALRGKYKDEKRKIEQRMWTSMFNGMEEDLWANPHGTAQYAEMEGDNGETPYSIPAFINEDTVTYHPHDWTNVATVDPATESKWRNQVERYATAVYDDTDYGVFAAFDKMFLKCRFRPPQERTEFFEEWNKQVDRQFIACSRWGMNVYQRLLRESNDTLVSKQDAAYTQPRYGGIPLEYVAELDTAALYLKSEVAYAEDSSELSGDAGDDWAGADGSEDWCRGPRYYWINGNYIKPIFHTSRYMMQHSPMRPSDQPFTTIVPVDTWWNLFPCSRQRHGIVGPGNTDWTA